MLLHFKEGPGWFQVVVSTVWSGSFVFLVRPWSWQQGLFYLWFIVEAQVTSIPNYIIDWLESHLPNSINTIEMQKLTFWFAQSLCKLETSSWRGKHPATTGLNGIGNPQTELQLFPRGSCSSQTSPEYLRRNRPRGRLSLMSWRFRQRQSHSALQLQPGRKLI